MLTLQPLALPGAPAWQTAEQLARLLDVERPEMDMNGQSRPERGQGARRQPAPERRLADQEQAGQPVRPAQAVGEDPDLLRHGDREVLGLVDDEDPAIAVGAAFREEVGQLAARLAEVGPPGQAQVVADQAEELGRIGRRSQVHARPAPRRGHLGLEPTPEPGLADARLARHQRGALRDRNRGPQPLDRLASAREDDVLGRRLPRRVALAPRSGPVPIHRASPCPYGPRRPNPSPSSCEPVDRATFETEGRAVHAQTPYREDSSSSLNGKTGHPPGARDDIDWER